MQHKIRGTWTEAALYGLLVVLVILAVDVAGWIGQSAHGDTPGIETTHHGVVISSTLPHCVNEDGSGEHRHGAPCTWNIGSTDGNGRGLAYVIEGQHADRFFDYVWINRPTAQPGWVWDDAQEGGYSDCAINLARDLEHCPDGTFWRVSTGAFLRQSDH